MIKKLIKTIQEINYTYKEWERALNQMKYIFPENQFMSQEAIKPYQHFYNRFLKRN